MAYLGPAAIATVPGLVWMPGRAGHSTVPPAVEKVGAADPADAGEGGPSARRRLQAGGQIGSVGQSAGRLSPIGRGRPSRKDRI